MSVAARVRRLLDTHGDSYAVAQERTGVSRETLRRIASGEEPPKLRFYLRKIAHGYGVDELALLEGASPKGEFEWNIRNASQVQRLEWLLMQPADRVKLTLDFLRFRYPGVIAPKVLASSCGLSEVEYRELMERWDAQPPDRAVAQELGDSLHSLTGIRRSWFESGSLVEEWTVTTPLSRVGTFCRKSPPAWLNHLKDMTHPGTAKTG